MPLPEIISRWQLRRVTAFSQQQDELLEEGWEPFAVEPGIGFALTEIWLRKRVINQDAILEAMQEAMSL